jgi:tetratricopeptide (TPR) repeat protein
MSFLRWLRAASAYERASAAALIVTLLLIAAAFASPPPGLFIPASPDPVVEPTADRPVQALYRIQREAWTPESLREAADLYARLGDLPAAAAHWERAQPTDAPTLRRLSETYLELGDWPLALAALERLLAAGEVDASWAHLQLGLIRASFNRDSALAHLRAAEADYGGSIAPLIAALSESSTPLGVGIALAEAELWPYAELAFSQADGGALALAYMGLARDRQGKDGSAPIARAAALEPQTPQVRYLQALHLRQVGDYAGSLSALVQATALDPENPALYAELASAYRLLGDLDSAERWYMQAVSLSNGDPRFVGLLEGFRAERGDLLAQLGLTDEPTDTVLPP